MDPVLHAIASQVERDANAIVGLTVALSSGHTISGLLVPNEDLHPLARRAVVDAVAARSAGTGRRGGEDGRAAAERWSRETAPPL